MDASMRTELGQMIIIDGLVLMLLGLILPQDVEGKIIALGIVLALLSGPFLLLLCKLMEKAEAEVR